MGLLSMLRAGDRITARRHKAYPPRLKPTLEDLESRTVLSHGSAASLVPVDVVNNALSRLLPTNVAVNSISLDNDAAVGLVNGALAITAADGTIGTLTGTIAGQAFSTTLASLTLQPDANAADDVCSVLHLELAPIHLAVPLLGVNLDTSAICLDITAHEGQGLLGSLLCNIVDNGLDIGGVTNVGAALTGDVADLANVVESSNFTSMVSSALSSSMASAQQAPGGGDDSICTGDCEILHLVLGPVDLDVPLLGVSVNLDNCAGGPVEVCLSANEGEGLLGSLLCGIVHDGLLDDLNFGQLNKLVGQVERILDGGLSAKDLLKLEKTVSQILGKLG